jgi:hypothetical protein
MIPVSVSDILKILDKIPIWNLPRRVSKLEKQVAELLDKAAKASSTPNGRECPICGATMKVLSELPHSNFGFAGRKIHALECQECGNKTNRDFEPGKGYR